MLAAGARICDALAEKNTGKAITNEKRANNFVLYLNTALKGAGIRQINETDSIKEIMSLMLTIGALNQLKSEGRLPSDFYAFSNQFFTYAPKNSTFAEANKNDDGKYHVCYISGEKYRVELPSRLVDRRGNPITNKQGEELTPKNARNYAFSTTLDNVSELVFDAGRKEYVVTIKDISKWFAMPMVSNEDGWCKMVLGKDGVLVGFAEGTSNNFVIVNETNWLSVLVRGEDVYWPGGRDGTMVLHKFVSAHHDFYVRFGVVINADNIKLDAALQTTAKV